MRGEFAGLQKLIRNDCPNAIYVHCWCHRLNLVVVDLASCNDIIEHFFGVVQDVYVYASGSTKRMDTLRDSVSDAIQNLIQEGKVTTGRGLNQQQLLGKLSDTRWNCRIRTLRSLKKIFKSIIEVFTQEGAEMQALELASKVLSFRFAFLLHMNIELLDCTQSLSLQCQSSTINFITAVGLINSAKERIKSLGSEEGFSKVLTETLSFCQDNEIPIPDLSDLWTGDNPLSSRKVSIPKKDSNLSVREYYFLRIQKVAMDAILTELEIRFDDETVRILQAASALDPRDKYQSPNKDKRVKELKHLAEHFYKADFSSDDIDDLESELKVFFSFRMEDIFVPLEEDRVYSFADLGGALYQKKDVFPNLYKLCCLLLVLPVTSAAAERSFSALKIIKTRLRTSMGDGWLVDLLILNCEREAASNLSNNEIRRVYCNHMGVSRRIDGNKLKK